MLNPGTKERERERARERERERRLSKYLREGVDGKMRPENVSSNLR